MKTNDSPLGIRVRPQTMLALQDVICWALRPGT